MRELRGQCIVCNGISLKPIKALYDQEKPQSDLYNLVHCDDCDMEFIQNPVSRNEIFQHYPTDSSAYKAELGDEISFVKRFLFWLDGRLLIKQLDPGDLVLDVGAGLGTFTHYLSKKGFQVAASDYVTEQIWPRKAIPYIQYDLNQSHMPIESFQKKMGRTPRAIVMRHVLEHVFDPLQLLTRLSELKPEYFLIMVPNGRSWLRYIFGKHWGFYDPPRHLSNFNKKSLAKLFSAIGYQTVQTTSYGMDEVVVSIYRGLHKTSSPIRKWFSWTSKAMLVSSALSLFFGRSVIVVLAKRKAA